MEVIIILVIASGLAYLAWRKLHTKLNDQLIMMRRFAADHGWEFTQTPNVTVFADVADMIGMERPALRVQYLIKGVAYEKEFELFLLIGRPRVHFNSRYGSLAVAYATVVRTRQRLLPPADFPPDTYETDNDGWNYIVYTANALSEQQISSLLNLLR